MEEKYLIEKLGAIKNEMSHIWGAIFVTGGGTLTLLSTSPSFFKIILAIIGFWLSVVFINAYFIRRNELLDILQEFKRGGTNGLV